MPQVSVLGLLLFLVCINDLDSDTVCEVLKFTEDTKLYFKVNRSNNDDNLRKDLEKTRNAV